MLCYKFVKPEKKKLFSVFGVGEFKVRYKKGRYVTVPSCLKKSNYHLLAFKTKEAAMDFRDSYLYNVNSILFEAEGYEQVLLPPHLPIRAREFHDFSNFKDYFTWVQTTYTSTKWPYNTLMFKKIKLLKEIKDGPLFP